MEMRKFVIVIDLHADGSLDWCEYTEPSSKEDWDYLCGKAFQNVAEKLNTYPCSLWPDVVKASYLNGASHMMDELRKVL